ncbi:MAG: hydrogenase iron-sulfur subunit [Euryarchaeota archaeon]|nr:hydrogenase iron-sulfur subunit [Euryarchaeota archaeon]MDE1837542.1 hydrogenase iron-sulfur subunit [Euryarchaeota archaeon]MDE1880023.1 hydrogenase iron-sulfur subunit [Euryarchaeota archaeon]MDE2046148.1 hydrogenase iron-sulfur subunit [Thermoplasmata archaeon]
MTSAAPGGGPSGRGPRILVLSTNNVSDSGIDLAGSAHVAYSPHVRVLAVPCSSGIDPRWVLHAFEVGFDGVFIAADGSDCAKISDCSARTGRIVARTQELMRAAGYDPARLKMAAVCSVCAEPFAAHMKKFGEELSKLAAHRTPPLADLPTEKVANGVTATAA